MKHFLQKVIFKCENEKATVGIRLNSEMAKTGLNVTANSDIRQITGVCVDNDSLLIIGSLKILSYKSVILRLLCR